MPTTTVGASTLPKSSATQNNKHYSEFLFRGSTWIVVILRFLLLIDIALPLQLSRWIQSPALRSVLINPVFTSRQLYEALAVQRLSVTLSTNIAPTFADAYRLKNVHLPPLILAALEPIAWFVSKFEFEPETSLLLNRVVIGLLVLAVDLIISVSLERIGRTIFKECQQQRNNDEVHDTGNYTGSWEALIERETPEAIRAPMSHVFELAPPPSSVSSSSTTTLDQQQSPSDNTNHNTESNEYDSEIPFRISQSDIPELLATFYFCSPITILCNGIFGCFQNLTLMFLLNGMSAAVRLPYRTVKDPFPGLVGVAFWLSLAANVELEMSLFLVPAVLFVRSKKDMFILCALFTTFTIYLHYLSFLLIGRINYFSVAAATLLQSFQIIGMSPNLSIIWYLGMECFQRFQTYYAILLGGVPYILVAPLTIRLFRYPMTLFAIFWLFKTLFQPPSTLYSLQVGLSFMMYSPRSLARMNRNVAIVSLLAFPVPVSLYVVLYWLWLETGSGEANFMFFQGLAFQVFICLLLIDFTGSSLRREKVNRLVMKMRCTKHAKQEDTTNGASKIDEVKAEIIAKGKNT